MRTRNYGLFLRRSNFNGYFLCHYDLSFAFRSVIFKIPYLAVIQLEISGLRIHQHNIVCTVFNSLDIYCGHALAYTRYFTVGRIYFRNGIVCAFINNTVCFVASVRLKRNIECLCFAHRHIHRCITRRMKRHQLHGSRRIFNGYICKCRYCRADCMCMCGSKHLWLLSDGSKQGCFIIGNGSIVICRNGKCSRAVIGKVFLGKLWFFNYCCSCVRSFISTYNGIIQFVGLVGSKGRYFYFANQIVYGIFAKIGIFIVEKNVSRIVCTVGIELQYNIFRRIVTCIAHNCLYRQFRFVIAQGGFHIVRFKLGCNVYGDFGYFGGINIILPSHYVYADLFFKGRHNELHRVAKLRACCHVALIQCGILYQRKRLVRCTVNSVTLFPPAIVGLVIALNICICFDIVIELYHIGRNHSVILAFKIKTYKISLLRIYRILICLFCRNGGHKHEVRNAKDRGILFLFIGNSVVCQLFHSEDSVCQRILIIGGYLQCRLIDVKVCFVKYLACKSPCTDISCFGSVFFILMLCGDEHGIVGLHIQCTALVSASVILRNGLELRPQHIKHAVSAHEYLKSVSRLFAFVFQNGIRLLRSIVHNEIAAFILPVFRSNGFKVDGAYTASAAEIDLIHQIARNNIGIWIVDIVVGKSYRLWIFTVFADYTE